MNKTIAIQPAERPDGKLPYPYFINEKGLVGRQDFWKGEPYRLIGFSITDKPGGTKHDIIFSQFWKNPDLAVGKFPIFEHKKGKMWFTYTDRISNINISEK